MKIIIVADINSNKIFVNNLYNIDLEGKIIIKYFDNIVYENSLILPKDQIFWYSPYLKMNDISAIKVIILDKNGDIFDTITPLIYVSFMRSSNYDLNNLCNFIKGEGGLINNIIEIGSYQGESTIIFSNNFPESRIFAVDFWKNNYDDREFSINSSNMIDVEHNFDRLTKDNSNIIKMKMSSIDFSNIIAENSIDFIYIDGDHTYKGISNDLKCWKNKVKHNGFIGGHDYNEEQKETVVKAISEFFPNNNVNVFGDNWIIKIN